MPRELNHELDVMTSKHSSMRSSTPPDQQMAFYSSLPRDMASSEMMVNEVNCAQEVLHWPIVSARWDDFSERSPTNQVIALMRSSKWAAGA